MDPLELALRQYQRIGPAGGGFPDATQSDALEAWLREAVCPVVDHLRLLRDFRNQALWSVQHLAPEAATPERRLVDAVDHALVGAGQVLAPVVRQPDVQAVLAKAYSPGGRPPASAKCAPPALGEPDRPEATTPEASVIEQIARRPWYDLVALEEYFQPHRELNLRQPVGGPLPSFDALDNPQLPPLADYICRTLFLRIKHWHGLLTHVGGRCLCALMQLCRDTTAEVEAVGGTLAALDAAVQALCAACLTGAAVRQREACVILVHVWAAYHPSPELDWLGPLAELVAPSRELIRQCLRRPVCDPQAFDRILAALLEAQHCYRQVPSAEDTLADLVAHKALVLVEAPRQVFWQQTELPVPWDANPLLWELLWALARRGQQGQRVDRFCLSNSESERAIVDRRSRLGRLLPAGLRALIRSAGRRTYRLDLAPEEIALVQRDDEPGLVPDVRGAAVS